MEKNIVHLKGIGQKNGVVIIDKKFEVDHNEVGKYTSSSTSKEYIQRAVDFYYPGLKSHDVKGVSVTREKINSKKDSNNFEKAVIGAAAGYVVGKSQKKKSNSKDNASSEFSFVNEISTFSQIDFNTNDESEIKNSLDKIYNGIIDYKWKSTGQDEMQNKIITENNRVLNMCLRNYSTGLRRLKSVSDNEEEIKYYEKQYKKLSRKKYFNKYGAIIIGVVAFVVLMSLLAIME